jgi:hypothetical protein
MGDHTLFVGRSRIDIQYDPKTQSSERDTIVAGAESKVRAALTKAERDQVDWGAFRTNLAEWLDAGKKDPLLSVRGLLTRNVVRRQRELALGVRTVGTEHELRDVQISGAKFRYNTKLASTKGPTGTTERPKLGDDGSIGKESTGWPHMKLTVDQYDKLRKTGIIEVVFGPLDVTDAKEIERRGRVSALLEQAIGECAGGKLSDAIAAYNTKLTEATKTDGELAKYHLEVDLDVDVKYKRNISAPDAIRMRQVTNFWKQTGTVDAYNAKVREAAESDSNYTLFTIDPSVDKTGPRAASPFAAMMNRLEHEEYTRARSSIVRSPQTNVEVPLRKIGDLGDATIPALFGAEEASDKAMFLEARRQANAYVDKTLRPIAATLHGGAYEEDSIKLDKLRAVFTLGLYAMAKNQDHSKAALPVLPKTGHGDLIREVLNARDLAVLDAATGDKNFDQTMVALSAKVRAKPGDQSVLDESSAMKHAALFHRGANPERWGRETTGYGTVNWDGGGLTGSETGKDIQTTYDRTRSHGVHSKEPKVVFEVRRMANPANELFESLIDPSGRKIEDQPKKGAYDVVKAAAALAIDREPKKAAS